MHARTGLFAPLDKIKYQVPGHCCRTAREERHFIGVQKYFYHTILVVKYFWHPIVC